TAAVYCYRIEPHRALIVARNSVTLALQLASNVIRGYKRPSLARNDYAQMDDAVDAAGPGWIRVSGPFGAWAAGAPLGGGERKPRSGEIPGVERVRSTRTGPHPGSPEPSGRF